MTLNEFILHFPDFCSKAKSEQIDAFSFYLLTEKGMMCINPKDIMSCFEELALEPHSNISSYLSRNSKKRGRKYLLTRGGYILEKKITDTYVQLLKKPKIIPMSDNLFPHDLLEHSRSYIQEIGREVSACFDNGLYNACSVMLRRLMETLIIELFEKYEISSHIKDENGDFLSLSGLITKLLSERSYSWNISRNSKKGFEQIKEIGDLSAHNRRYIAKKSDIEKIRSNARVCIQELLTLIDYPNWKK